MIDKFKLTKIKRRIEKVFSSSDWQELALLTDCYDIINNHPRLLRSLSYGDEDYDGCVVQVLLQINSKDSKAIDILESYLNKIYPEIDNPVSLPNVTNIPYQVSPKIFTFPNCKVENDLVGIMMPFGGCDNIHSAIKKGCLIAGLKSIRADDIWQESTILQDIVNVIYRSNIIVVDFSGKNPNVMYETGIAHTLGKIVIPIAQDFRDIPSDMAGHRALLYHSNNEGLEKLSKDLGNKLGAMGA